MRFDQRIEVKAGPEEVWAFLWEVERVARCLPGCQEVRETEPQKKYDVVVEQRVGQFKVRFNMAVSIVDMEAQRFVRLLAEGQEKKLGASTRGELEVKLEPIPSGGTALEIGSDIQVVGKIAAFGQAIIKRKARQVMDGFGQALVAELER
jgi:carbon monoxide dehydrogenase subunit G